MLSWLIISAITIAIVLLFATYLIEPGTLMIIERSGKFRRIATEGYNWLIPVLDNPAAILELQPQRLATEFDVNINALSQAKANITLRYSIDPAKADTAHYNLPDPATPLKNKVTEIITGKVIAASNHGRQPSPEDLKNLLQQNLTSFLNENGYKLNQVDIIEFKYNDSAKNINLNSTLSFSKLLKINMHEREQNWIEKCDTAIWTTCFIQHEIMHTIAQDSCPYIQLRTPCGNSAIKDPISFPEALQAALDQGHGLMFYAANDSEPAWALTFGDVLQLQNANKLPGKMGIAHNELTALTNAELIPMGPVDKSIMTDHARNIASEFMKNIGIKQPAAMQATKIGSDLTLAVVFNIFPDDFSSEDEYEKAKYQIRWLLPANINLLFAKHKQEFADSFSPLQLESAAILDEA